MCLKNPTDAFAIVKPMKKEAQLPSAATHPLAKYVATVAKATSWCQLWDLTLDRYVQGTRGLQTLLNVLSHGIYKDPSCPSCGTSLHADSV